MFLAATRILNDRLEACSRAPLIVALSGGGDSLALLLIAKAWADGAGRRLIAVTVDHRLQTAGAQWAAWCAERAGRLGVEHRILFWDGPKPRTGLPAAARRARHELIAGAARAEGAAVILMGHTADDGLEAAAMRAAGSTTPTPREWAPSPVWPQGRDIFLLRPLLGERRRALRCWLSSIGETWIDDPANDDARFARARARAALSGDGRPVVPCASPRRRAHAEDVTAGLAELIVPRAAFARPDARAFLAALLLSASGAERPPRGVRLDRLATVLGGEAPVVATLAGARVEADPRQVRAMREPGEFRRNGSGEMRLLPGVPAVWDGRFVVVTQRDDLRVRPLGGLASRLAKAERAALRGVHPVARRTLPALVDGEGQVICPILADSGQARLRSLVAGRLWAACGAVQDEAAIWRVAKTGATS